VTAARYIALEGVEGCGKSTQARILAERLGATLTRETGGTEIGRRLRDVLHDPTNTHLDPIAESLMIAADLEPVLSAGGRIVSDRSVWSSLAYQGYGRGLDLDMIRQVNDWALGGFWPDLVVVVDVSSDVVAERLRHRDLDRFEREDGAFFERVAAGFTTLAQQHPTSWRIVDGTAAIDDVAAAVWDTVMTWTP
jgi:dTMP kinase